jgi:hypothetical protein
MTDLKINWSAAPEGATHYDNDPENPSWIRYLQGAESHKLFEFFYWAASAKEWVPVSGYILGTLTPKPEAAPKEKDKSADMVKNPSHYQLLGYETVEIIVRNLTVEQWRGACLFNALKYRIRAGKKDKLEQDIAKANQFEIMFDQHKQLCIDWSE